MKSVTFCKTNKGDGYKIVVNDKWLYTSKDSLLKVILGEAPSCQFNAFKDEAEEDEE